MACAGDVFDHGCHGTSLAKVEQATRCCATSPVDAQSPPKPLLVAAPCDAGEYPVVLFLHGYLCNNYFYSQLLHHVASHGFIVIAPQLYTVSGPDTTGEINSAAAVIDWLAASLSSKLPPGIRPNLTAVSISGHSRGGKVAFALALGHAKTSLPLAALIAVDPVDGTGMGNQTPPPILVYKPNALRVPAPVARDYGHTDMMDDVTTGAKGLATRALCKSGGARAPMRRFVAGTMVAFLKKWVQGKPEWLDAMREQTVVAPVVLSVVEFRDE